MGRLLRFLLFVCALAAPVPASAQLGGLAEWTPAPLSFTVLRDGSPIGTHRLSFTREGERVVLGLAVRLRAERQVHHADAVGQTVLRDPVEGSQHVRQLAVAVRIEHLENNQTRARLP